MSTSESKTFLSSVKALVIEQGLGKTRTKILAKQLENHGGEVVKTLSSTTTHILVGNSSRLARVLVLLKVDSIPKDAIVLRANWLSACLTKKQLVPEEEYRVYPDSKIAATSPSSGPISSPKTTLQTTPTKVNSTQSRLAGHSDDEHGIASGNESCQRSTDLSMMSPKAGMFSVTSRHWTSSSTSSKVPARPKAAEYECDSDSDYVESEEEEGETAVGDDDAGPPERKVRNK